jgi:hypothetical protein
METMLALATVRIANNFLTGVIPEAIGNLTSLTAFDFSDNRLSGQLPHTVGLMSEQLESASLELNHLSCELPRSVVAWKSPSDVRINLLGGNLFGCSQNGPAENLLAVSDSTGLSQRDSQAASYVCADKLEAAVRVSVLSLILFPLVVMLAVLWIRGGFNAAAWAPLYSLLFPPPNSSGGDSHPFAIHNAALEMTGLAASVGALCLLGLGLMLPVLYFAPSPYTCQYFARSSLGYKHSEQLSLSVVSGFAASFGLVISLFVWWWRLIPTGQVEDSRPKLNLEDWNDGASSCTTLEGDDDDNGGELRSGASSRFSSAWFGPGDSMMENPFDGDDDAKADEAPQSRTSVFLKVLAVTLRLLFVVASSVGPNILYILVAINQNVSSTAKGQATIGIIFFKTVLTTAVLPWVARSTVNTVVPRSFPQLRFQFRTTATVALYGLTTLLIPIIVVLLTDPRCFYYTMIGKPPVENNDISVDYCSNQEDDGSCSLYSTAVVTSRYAKTYDYEGAKCVSAVLFFYGPVFELGVFFNALLPVFLEYALAPALVPWCFRHRKQNNLACFGLKILRVVSLNVPLLVPRHEHKELFSTPPEQQTAMHNTVIDNTAGDEAAVATVATKKESNSLEKKSIVSLARRIVERGITQLSITLMISLTFGLAVPASTACAVAAATIQLTHHLHLLSSLHSEYAAELEHGFGAESFFGAPTGVAVSLALTTLAVWMSATINYMDFVSVGSTAVATLVCSAGAIAAFAFHRQRTNQHRASGMLMKPLLSTGGINQNLRNDNPSVDQWDHLLRGMPRGETPSRTVEN